MPNDPTPTEARERLAARLAEGHDDWVYDFPLTLDEARALVNELLQLREHVEIGTRCLADIVSNGHRRTGPACAGFALTALMRMGALTTDADALDTREPPSLTDPEAAP